MPNTAFAGGKAKGTLTVDGNMVELKHAAARPLFDDIIILLTDNPVNKDAVPDGVATLSGQKKIRGIMFSISAKNKRLLGKGESIQGIYFYPVWDQLGTIGNGELKISKIEGDIIKARIYTTSENDWGEHKFSYDVNFTIDTRKVPPKIEISGAHDKPAKAFSEYYKAVMAGNVDEFKKFIANERLKEIEKEPGMMTFFIEMQQAMSPTVINIVSSEITGDKALLTISGSRGTENASGKIFMVKEDDVWKVDKEEWLAGELN